MPWQTQAEEVLDVLDRALALMNDEGAHWAQGSYLRDEPGVGFTYCSVGAIGKVAEGDPLAFASFYPQHTRAGRAALSALAQAYGATPSNELHDVVGRITGWNDNPNTTWKKVVARFNRAKAVVRKQEKAGLL